MRTLDFSLLPYSSLTFFNIFLHHQPLSQKHAHSAKVVYCVLQPTFKCNTISRHHHHCSICWRALCWMAKGVSSTCPAPQQLPVCVSRGRRPTCPHGFVTSCFASFFASCLASLNTSGLNTCALQPTQTDLLTQLSGYTQGELDKCVRELGRFKRCLPIEAYSNIPLKYQKFEGLFKVSPCVMLCYSMTSLHFPFNLFFSCLYWAFRMLYILIILSSSPTLNAPFPRRTDSQRFFHFLVFHLF